ncbi:MBL fold metallo-hydrolase [Gloeocapsopsis sp. IPPAS B-1203]|uniref:MBL fold metallo-hydrolase n=1 Tax=Gloeocapsopsis sp. IPPAS B-1203 TaxID=2049454 RepID=UPI00117EB64D|nr:MBL fold metallo-hydrolase [Gloeocapsopsis sp. IPPAS B-1203]
MNQNPEQLAHNSAQNSLPKQSSRVSKPPQEIWKDVFVFPPNRDTLGGTAYLIVENDANILIDCPPWNEDIQQFLQSLSGVRWLFLTHRGAIGRTKELQKTLNCQVVVQEQEAYLLPGVSLTSFQDEITLSLNTQAIWTPGHSPGSACLYYSGHGGVLFSGRHLLPNQQGEPMPLRTAKTFHWRRQISSIEKILQRFTPDTLQYICPGANTGFLRGQKVIAQAYQRLAALDLSTLVQSQAPL